MQSQMSQKTDIKKRDLKKMCEIIIKNIITQRTAINNEFGSHFFKILWGCDIFKQPIEKILEPLLDSPDDLECILTGSVKERRKDIGRDTLRTQQNIELKSNSILNKQSPDLDIMIIMKNRSPVQVRETNTPGFYYVSDESSKFQPDGTKLINSQSFKQKFSELMLENIDPDNVEIKKPEPGKSTPAIRLRIETGHKRTPFLEIDLVPALKTDLCLEETKLVPGLKEALQESQFETLKSLPIYVVPKSSSVNAFDWRVSYSLHEDFLMTSLINANSLTMNKYYGPENSRFNQPVLPSFVLKTMHLHLIIANKSSLVRTEKLESYLREIIILEEKLPHPCNKNIKIIQTCVHNLWHKNSFQNHMDDKEEKYMLLKEYLNLFHEDVQEEGRFKLINQFVEMKISRAHRYHQAAMKGNVKLVEQMKSSKINEKFNEMTPLFVACLFGQIDVVKTLISKRAAVNLPFTRKEITCLHITCLAACKETDNSSTGSIEFYNEYMYEFIDILKGSCMYGDKFDIVNYSIESFGKRIVNDDDSLKRYQNIIKLLLENGANPNAVTRDGVSALILCCKNCNLESAKLLVESGADVNQTTWTGMTSLSIACLHGDYHIAEFLLENGAHVIGGEEDKNRKSNFNLPGPDHLLATVSQTLNPLFGNLRHNLLILFNKFKLYLPIFVNCPLTAACASGNMELVELLIQRSKTVYTNTAEQSLLLSLPLGICCQFGHLSICQFLISALRCSKNFRIEELNNYPLILACEHGYVEIVKYFLDLGVSDADLSNLSLLQIAIEKNYINIVKLLIGYGENIHDERHKTYSTYRVMPLIRACAHGFTKIAEILLENGADVDELDYMNEAAISKAVLYNNYNTVELLLRYGANVGTLNSDLDSPLHLAIRFNYPEIQQLLLDYGADTELKDAEDGFTTLLTAVAQNNFMESVKLLINRGADVNGVSSKCQRTPLDVTCCSYHEGTVETIKLLIENGADVNVRDSEGCTPLHLVCMSSIDSSVEPLQTLLRNGADVNARDDVGRTPLHVTCSRKTLKSFIEMEILKSGGKDVSDSGQCASEIRIETVALLVKYNADVHIVDNDGNSPLHIACSHDCVQIVEILKNHNANSDFQNFDGTTPLHVACGYGHVAVVEILVKNNADVNLQDKNGQTPLHSACQVQNIETVECLLNHGAEVNIPDNSGSTPLVTAFFIANKSRFDKYLKKDKKPAAISHGVKNEIDWMKEILTLFKDQKIFHAELRIEKENYNMEIVELLISRGANVNWTIVDSSYTKTETLLHLACHVGSYKFAEILIKNGANVTEDLLFEACKNGDRDMARLLIENGASTNIQVEAKTTLLHMISINGDTEIVKLLIENGSDVNRECHGMTPLHHSCFLGHSEIVKVLIEHGAQLNVDSSKEDISTPLMSACQAHNREIAKLLVQHGADVNFLIRGRASTGSPDSTVLHCAAATDDIICCEILVELGANVNAVDKSSGYTPLHIACRRGFVEMVKLLLKSKANLNVRSFRGFTPLHHVVEISGNKEIAKLLMRNGADATIENNFSVTPLQLACCLGKTDVAEVLINLGADVNVTNRSKLTALHII